LNTMLRRFDADPEAFTAQIRIEIASRSRGQRSSECPCQKPIRMS
jgi:hypothetical protein